MYVDGDSDDDGNTELPDGTVPTEVSSGSTRGRNPSQRETLKQCLFNAGTAVLDDEPALNQLWLNVLYFFLESLTTIS